MSEHALTIAKFFLEKAASEGQSLTPMKLIKLVYISHGWWLGFGGQPLVNESIEAWKYGPVIRSIYRYFSDYGAKPIDPAEAANLPTCTDQSALPAFLNSVWKVYSHFNGLQLSTLTHQPQTPWYKTWHDHGGSRHSSAVIPNEEIAEYYKQLIRERQ